MALIPRSLPDEVQEAFRRAFEGDEDDLRFPDNVQGQPVYGLGLPGLGAASPAVRHVGWQFQGVGAGGAGVTGDVPGARRGDQPLTGSTETGPRSQKVWEAYEDVRRLPELGGGDYEAWAVRIPELRIEAFWLKAAPFESRIGGRDLFYPVISFWEELPERKLVRADEFLRVLRRLGEAQVKRRLVL
jgi:hypothetical protein